MTTFSGLRGAARKLPPKLTVVAPTVAEATPAVRAMTWVLGAVSALCIWLVVFAFVLSGLYEGHAQHGLYADFREQLALATAPIGGSIAEGAPVAVIDAPDAAIHNLVAVQGSSSTDLREGPGHTPGTPLPGQYGVSVLMGRSATFGAPFGRITDLQPGDKIQVTTGQGQFTYLVEDVRRPGDPFPPTLVSGSRLTLVTSEGSGWRSGWAPTEAVYVDALLQGNAVGAPANTSQSSTADSVMAGDSRGLYPLVLWLQLLVVGVVGAVWARARWGAWQTWLVGTPVVVAALWGASISAAQLLPNLI